jgi:cell division septum initiation protein DivIVA
MSPAPLDPEGIRNWPLERGRGYATASVEELREAAARALEEALERAAALEDAIQMVQAEAGARRTDLDIPSLVAQLDPERLRQAGIEAVGRALVEAQEEAQRVRTRARNDATRMLSELGHLATALASTIDQGRNLTYDVERLRRAAATVAEAAGMPVPPPPPRPTATQPSPR